jgi:MYXO-CTERM domain-containing protein
MWTRLAIAVPTVIVSLVLTFAPVFAQETVDDRGDYRPAATAADDGDDDPDYGWLGLLGLAGLGGLMRRDRDRDVHRHTDRTTHS